LKATLLFFAPPTPHFRFGLGMLRALARNFRAACFPSLPLRGEGGSEQSELTDEVARKMRSEASIFGLLG
jgi:hypothetical protein